MNIYNKYSDKDIIDWRTYERVRLTGKFNMYDPRAIDMTGLTRERYIFIMEHYDHIRIQSHIEKMKNIESLSKQNG
jgi:hypothetical protein